MSQKLKIDFHVHTGEDPKDRHIVYSAKQLLDHAAEYHFDAITIANHGAVLYSEALRDYAAQRNILLIPGVEAYVEGKHVLIVNCRTPYRHQLTYQNVRAYAGPNALIIAPHPFYPRSYCLGEQLELHLNVFDAIEYAHLYYRFLNFNARAVALARKHGLPLIGNSDAHTLKQLNSTYTLVEAEKSIPAIIAAVKANRVELVTHPLSVWDFMKKGSYVLYVLAKRLLRKTL